MEQQPVQSASFGEMQFDGTSLTFTSPIGDLVERHRQASLWAGMFEQLASQVLEQVPGAATVVLLTDADVLEILDVLGLQRTCFDGLECTVVRPGVHVGLLARDAIDGPTDVQMGAFDGSGNFLGHQVLDRRDFEAVVDDRRSPGTVLFPRPASWSATDSAGRPVAPPVRALAPLPVDEATGDRPDEIWLADYVDFAESGFDLWRTMANTFQRGDRTFAALTEVYGPHVIGHLVLLTGHSDYEPGREAFWRVNWALDEGSPVVVGPASTWLPPLSEWPGPEAAC